MKLWENKIIITAMFQHFVENLIVQASALFDTSFARSISLMINAQTMAININGGQKSTWSIFIFFFSKAIRLPSLNIIVSTGLVTQFECFNSLWNYAFSYNLLPFTLCLWKNEQIKHHFPLSLIYNASNVPKFKREFL